jgi:dipeptidyl aminopeptidase/acylaminoacyl peptidase
MKNYLIIICVLIIKQLAAQLPNTDIWLLDVKANKDTVILSNPVNITSRAGYDNQPAFSPDGKYILYTSIRDEKQSDIYKYDLKSKRTSQFTNTPTTSEYSPTFMPDGKNISVVMVEPDSAQRLWKFPVKGGTPSLIMDKVDSIGYHCWLDSNNIALFLITSPFQLVFTNIKTQKSMTIVHDTICRGMNLQKVFDTSPYFIYAYKRTFYAVDIKTNKHFPLCNKNYPGEDFCFITPSNLIMPEGAKLYRNYTRFADSGKDWTLTADLSGYGFKKITRIAVSPDGSKIAIVAE